jgi:AcrR family transcriptional regulator
MTADTSPRRPRRNGAATVTKTVRRAVASAPGRPARRTQAERRAETRRRLLDATIASLDEVGYAATTTRRVAELAAVSQGAMTHHFPHRVDLVAAAVEELAARRVAELRLAASTLPRDPAERASALLDLLWADFSSPLFTVFVKLWVAAADDEELYARLVPVERMLARTIVEAASEFGGELLQIPDWESRVLVLLSTLRGLALAREFEPRERRGRDPWPKTREILERALLPAGWER